jgi:regulator of PEP synthase PpsR (kinase-PPPase family)
LAGGGIKIVNRPVVYILSDSVGETAEFVVRAAASQFNSGQVEIRRIPYVRDIANLREILQEVRESKGVLIYTLVLPELRDFLRQEVATLNIPSVDIMGPVVETIGELFPHPPRLKPGLVYQLDEEYFRKVEAIEFAVKYDDGKEPRGILWADVVLIGVSRTSKTPLSMYLAHKGLRAANIPLVPEVNPPEELFVISPRKVVGLTILPSHLLQIRQERLKNLGLKGDAAYANPERILAELRFAEEIMARVRCPVIDVSNKAVEETAGEIARIIKKGW